MWIECELVNVIVEGGRHILISIDSIKSIMELKTGCSIEYGDTDVLVKDSYKDIVDVLNRKSI